MGGEEDFMSRIIVITIILLKGLYLLPAQVELGVYLFLEELEHN